MMDELEQATDSFVASIIESDIYREYRVQLEKVKQFPELKAQIDEFRKRNFEFQSSADIHFDKLDRFEKEYETFREQPLVSDFLAAELALCRLMQGLMMRITAELNFE